MKTLLKYLLGATVVVAGTPEGCTVTGGYKDAKGNSASVGYTLPVKKLPPPQK